MESLFRRGRNEPVKEVTVDRVRLSAVPLYSYEENRGIYQVLKDRKEPIEIIKSGEDDGAVVVECSREKEIELKTIIRLLRLSPVFQLINSARSSGAPSSENNIRLFNDIINSSKGGLTDNEKILFDPKYPTASSLRQLLYTPFSISNDLRDGLIATAKQAEEKQKEAKRNQGKKKKPFLDRLITFGEGIALWEEVRLIARAYEDLMAAVGGREYFSTSRYDELMINDYENPALLLVEELEERGYGVDLFRVAAASGGYRKTVDGIDDCIVVLADNKAMDILHRLRRSGAMAILNELYRGRGISFSAYTEHLFSPSAKPHSDWEESNFSEEERNMLLVFAIERIIGIERNNLALEGKRIDSSKDDYWRDLRRKTKNLGVESADQIFLRRIIGRLVEKELA